MMRSIGMLAVVRNCHGIVSRVERSGAAVDGMLHVVSRVA